MRLGLAFTTDGNFQDMEAYRAVFAILRRSGFDAYEHFAAIQDRYAWPYPSGFFPLVFVATAIANLSSLSFASVIRLPMVVADIGIALAVVYYLGASGRSERDRLFAGALVALGPVFILVSGFHGQFDSVMILPAILSVIVWELRQGERATRAGLLLGIAGTLKTAPLLLLAALVPRLRSFREGIRVAVATAIVPVALLFPFLVSSPAATISAFRYRGLAGFGGISLLVQPSLSGWWIDRVYEPSKLSQLLFENGLVIAGVIFAVVALFLVIRRASPLEGAVLIWLAFYAFMPNFAFSYLVWGMPFFLMAGHMRSVLALQLFVMAPVVIVYGSIPRMDIYVPLMLILWAAFVCAFVVRVVVISGARSARWQLRVDDGRTTIPEIQQGGR